MNGISDLRIKLIDLGFETLTDLGLLLVLVQRIRALASLKIKLQIGQEFLSLCIFFDELDIGRLKFNQLLKSINLCTKQGDELDLNFVKLPWISGIFDSLFKNA